jgi:hypothetical protein
MALLKQEAAKKTAPFKAPHPNTSGSARETETLSLIWFDLTILNVQN